MSSVLPSNSYVHKKGDNEPGTVPGFFQSAWMNTATNRLQLPPEAELTPDFIEALVVHYEFQSREIKQPVRALPDQVHFLTYRRERTAAESFLGVVALSN
jgi:hypothetical protein